MPQLWTWLPVLVLVVAGAFLVWRDPRRMLPGLVLTVALFLVAGQAAVALMSLGNRLDSELGAVWVLLGFTAASILAVTVLGVFLIWNTVEMTRKEGLRPAAIATGLVGAVFLSYVVLSVIAVRTNSVELVLWLILFGLPISYLGFVFTAYLLYSVSYVAATNRFGRAVDAVVVLGSGLLGGNRVSRLLAARIDLGRHVYEKSRAAGRGTVLLPSGGQGEDEELSEAEAMRRYMLDKGVEPGHIIVEDRSRDTRQNLLFSTEVMKREGISGEVAVATNNFHAFRAAILMREAGLPGYSVGAPTARYYWPSATVREFLAILRDHLKVNVVMVVLASLPLLAFAATRFIGIF